MPWLTSNLFYFILLTYSQQCCARYSYEGGIEEHETVPPNVQLMITGSKDPLDPVVLEEFQHDALLNAKILVELGKNELRTLSKLTGTVIGSDLLFGIPEEQNYDVEENYYGESFTGEGEDNKTIIANEHVKGRANKTNTLASLIDPAFSVPNEPPPNLASAPPSSPPPQPGVIPPYTSNPPIANTVQPQVPTTPTIALPPNTNPPLPLTTANNPQQQMPLPVTQPIIPTTPNQQQMASPPIPPQPPVILPSPTAVPSTPIMNNYPFSNTQQQAVPQPLAPISQYSTPTANIAPPSSPYSAPPQSPSNLATTFQQPSLPQAQINMPITVPSPFIPQTSTNTPPAPANPVSYPSPYIPVYTPDIASVNPPTKPYNPLAGDAFHNSFAAASPTWSTALTPYQYSNPLSSSQPEYTLPPAAFQTQR